MKKSHITAVNKYNKKNYKQITIRLKKNEYEDFVKEVNKSGMSKNQYIIKKILP